MYFIRFVSFAGNALLRTQIKSMARDEVLFLIKIIYSQMTVELKKKNWLMFD